MISRAGRFAYAHGHLGARHGARPGLADWARLQAIGDAQSFVEAARRTAIAGLMGGIPPTMAKRGDPIHAVEARLRERWREEVRRVAHWYGKDDRPAVEWLSLIPLLPAISHLARGDRASPWMEAEGSLAPFLKAASGDKDALPRAGLTCFARVFTNLETAGTCWFEHWRTLWPAAKAERAGFELLYGKVAELSGAGAGGEPVLPPPDVLDPVFEKSFRRNARNLVAGIAYLGLVANDLRRLRGQIALRLALPALQRQGAVA